jgi:hypothetical protein
MRCRSMVRFRRRSYRRLVWPARADIHARHTVPVYASSGEKAMKPESDAVTLTRDALRSG